MEIENNNSLPFLDVLITKSNDNSFSHTVYRKPTHTNRYLHADSHHHPAQINSVAKTLIQRCIRLSDDNNRPHELHTLRHALLQNGYSNTQISRSINQSHIPKPSSVDESIHKAFLPYVKGVTDKIGRILKKQDIKTIFTANNKISNYLRSPKDNVPNESHGVYEIPCSQCPKTYIGQTNRRISSRAYEHNLAVRKFEPTSALAQHRMETGHTIDFKNTKTIATEKAMKCRIIREAIEIDKRPNCLNKRDDSQRLPNTWRPLISRLQILNIAADSSVTPEPAYDSSVIRQRTRQASVIATAPPTCHRTADTVTSAPSPSEAPPASSIANAGTPPTSTVVTRQRTAKAPPTACITNTATVTSVPSTPTSDAINTAVRRSQRQYELRSRQIETLASTSDETWGVGRLRPRRQVTTQ